MDKSRFNKICYHIVRFIYLTIALVLKLFAFSLTRWGEGDLVNDQHATNNLFGLWERCFCIHKIYCMCRTFDIRNLPGWYMSVQAMETVGFVLLLIVGVLMFAYFFRACMDIKIYKRSACILIIKIPVDVASIAVFCIHVKEREPAVGIAIGSTAMSIFLLACLLIEITKLPNPILNPQTHIQMDACVYEPRQDSMSAEQNRHNVEQPRDISETDGPNNFESIPDERNKPIAYGPVETCQIKDINFGSEPNIANRHSYCEMNV